MKKKQGKKAKKREKAGPAPDYEGEEKESFVPEEKKISSKGGKKIKQKPRQR